MGAREPDTRWAYKEPRNPQPRAIARLVEAKIECCVFEG